MAEEDVDDPELKDEELVDFEGSDYDIGSEEEFELEAEVFGSQITEEPQESKRAGEAGLYDRTKTENFAGIVESVGEIRAQVQLLGNEDTKLPEFQKIPDAVPSSKKEAAESGEIEEDKDDKDEGAVQQPSANTLPDSLKSDIAVGVGEVRQRRHGNSDLEDGELDDAAMLEGFHVDIEGEVKGDIVGREKKRRRDRFVIERQIEDNQGNSVKESGEEAYFATRQHQHRGRIMERLAGLSRAGGRGVNMQMMSFGQVNMAPNAMGPGRTLMPFGVRGLGRAFGPRHNVHLQELLTQEHILRARAMQLAQGSIAGAMRAPMTGPLGGGTLRPTFGFDFLGPGSHNLLQCQPQPSDLIARMSTVGPVDGFIRGQRPNLAVGGMAGSGKPGRQVDSALGCGMRRQGGWPLVPGADELQSLARGRQGRASLSGPWSEAHAMGHGAEGQGLAVGQTYSNSPFDAGGASQGSVASNENVSSGKVSKVGWLGMSVSQPDGASGPNGSDVRWKLERERILRNGVMHGGLVGDGYMEENISGFQKESGKVGIIKKGKVKVSVLQANLPSSIVATHSSSELQEKSAALAGVSSSRSSAGNVIQLLQPIQKSRMLTVSGLPDNISMSTIVEAFEKQGKITDLRKGPKEDVFTISYSTETEAVTAKRSLHRSLLAGRQITVEYAYP